MSTPSAAHSLDGALDVSAGGETGVVGDVRARDLVEPIVAETLESTNEPPMQFVLLGLPAAIFLWFVVGLVAYGAYRFLAG